MDNNAERKKISIILPAKNESASLKKILQELTTLYKDEEGGAITALVFPLAFPLIAGPGSLTTLLSLRAEFYIENIIIAVLVNVLVIYIVLKTSAKIERIIGPNGIKIIRKVFGVILLAIAVKLFATNIKALF